MDVDHVTTCFGLKFKTVIQRPRPGRRATEVNGRTLLSTVATQCTYLARFLTKLLPELLTRFLYWII